MKKPIDFSKYVLDRDIPEGIWNKYLLKYQSEYRIKYREDKINSIMCAFGDITPYSLLKGYLVYFGDFPSPNKKSYLLRKLPPYCIITQEGYAGVGIKFPESKLKEVEGLFKIKKKRQLSEDAKQVLRERLQKARDNISSQKKG